MKITRKQWLLILMGILLILLLWYMAKQRGTSGAGATSDTGEETSAGDATLRPSSSNTETLTGPPPTFRQHDILI